MTEGPARDIECLDGHRFRRDFGWTSKTAPAKQPKNPGIAVNAPDPKPCTEFEIRSYADLVLMFRQRVQELQISHECIDEIAGFPDRFATKLLSVRHVKAISPLSLGPLLETLGILLVPVIDEAAMERHKSRRVPRDEAHWQSATARHSRSA
jgi:hypothetical protein